MRFLCCLSISIHALAKRATYTTRLTDTVLIYFNPRPRKEGDTDTYRSTCLALRISIHALAKRATTYTNHYPLQKSFQSTPSQRGRRTVLHSKQPCKIYFNPRPRKEGDCATVRRHSCHRNFNPRPRKEGDF